MSARRGRIAMPRSDHRHTIARRKLLRAVLGIAAAVLAAGTTPAATAQRVDAGRVLSDAAARVAWLREIAIAIARRDGGETDALAELGRKLRAAFDLETIARSVLGGHWDSASTDEQYDFVELISDLLSQAAVTELGHRGGEPFAIIGTRRLDDGDIVVQSRITLTAPPNAGRMVGLDWRMRPSGSALNFVDISVDAKSMVVKYRQEIADRIRVGGQSIRAVIVAVRERLPQVAY